MVDDVYDVGGREVLEDGDDDRSVGDRRQIGDAPARIVAADERDLVAAADLRFFEEEMQFGDLLGHLVVRKGFALEIVGQRRQLAVSAEALFVHSDQILLQHSLGI